MKFTSARAYADPEKAARKLIEIANSVEAVQDGRIYIELINVPFLADGDSPAEYKAGLEGAISRGWLGAKLQTRRMSWQDINPTGQMRPCLNQNKTSRHGWLSF
jgi:hypothetical protein